MSSFKDFGKNLGIVAKQSAIVAGIGSIRNAQLSAMSGDGINVGNLDNDIDNSVIKNFILDANNPLVNTGSAEQLTNIISYEKLAKRYDQKFGKTTNYVNDSLANIRYVDDDSDTYKFSIPDWGYNDFVNERNIFIKHLSNGYDEPGWFYFKLFFDFGSNHGLFGSILRNSGFNFMSTSPDEDTYETPETGVSSEMTGDQEGVPENYYSYAIEHNKEIYKSKHQFISINSAYKFLLDSEKLFAYDKLVDRRKCLEKFTRLLSFINVNAPWFFNSIKNLSALSNPQLNKFDEEKYIEIELAQEAIDMRISTLLSLYKYACFDDINNKEIIPENLRKFDLCLVIFQTPIKFIHTNYDNIDITDDDKIISLSNNLYNVARSDIPENVDPKHMSFKLYKFMNCEIDPNSLGGHIPSDIKNDVPFELGKNVLRINFDKVYEYTMSEFLDILVGSDGLYYESSNNQITVKDVQNLINSSEDIVHNAINMAFGNDSNFILGNIYGQDMSLMKPQTNIYSTSVTFTKYAKAKFEMMSFHKKSNWILDTGYDMLYKLLGTGYTAAAQVLSVNGEAVGDGTVLNGHGQYRVGSLIWEEKMKRMATGSGKIGEREMALSMIHSATNTDWKSKLNNYALSKVNPLKWL